MKRNFIIPLSMLVAFWSCTVIKADYHLPEAMLPHVKEEYSKRCDKGKILYELNCASCHNIPQGRKQIVPDFSQEKLQGYALRISNKSHENSMPDSLITEEELVVISDYLKYKKPSGISAHGKTK